MNHLSKSNRFLLSQFVYLYSSRLIGVDCPSVAQSSAGVDLTRQLIKSLGSWQQHGQRARRSKDFDALGNSFSRLLGTTPIQDPKE